MLFNKKKNKFLNLFRKKSKIEKFYLKNEEFIKYSLVSLICTFILYFIFFISELITKGNYIISNFISYTISFTILYIWDEKIFKSKFVRKKDRINQAILFIIIRIIGFPLDSFILHILISKFKMNNMIAKVFASLIMFIYNYITNKLFVFKKNKSL